MKPHSWTLLLSLVAATAVTARDPSPYVGQQTREIAALSAEQVQSLLAGKGMGYAKAAELNAYPGPAHVLELAAELQLSADQRAQTQAIFERMDTAAKALGAELVAAERALDGAFRSQQIGAAKLQRLTTLLGRLQGELRNVHLHAHLEQTEILSQQQIDSYVRLRGYAHGQTGHEGHH